MMRRTDSYPHLAKILATVICKFVLCKRCSKVVAPLWVKDEHPRPLQNVSCVWRTASTEDYSECTMIFTWREIPKVKEGQPVKLNTSRNTSFSLPICWQGKRYKKVLHVRFRFFMAHHHHLWWECGGCVRVACPLQRHEGVQDLFCHLPHSLQALSRRFTSVQGLMVHIHT